MLFTAFHCTSTRFALQSCQSCQIHAQTCFSPSLYNILQSSSTWFFLSTIDFFHAEQSDAHSIPFIKTAISHQTKFQSPNPIPASGAQWRRNEAERWAHVTRAQSIQCLLQKLTFQLNVEFASICIHLHTFAHICIHLHTFNVRLWCRQAFGY